MAMSRLPGVDSATTIGLLTAAGVYLIYNEALPSITDIRAAAPHDNDVEKARKAAAWKSAILIGIVFVVARDLNSYIISGAALVGIDYMTKHGNGINPHTGKIDASDATVAPSLAGAYPMPEYADAA